MFKGKYAFYRKDESGAYKAIAMGNITEETRMEDGEEWITYTPDKDSESETGDFLYLNGDFYIVGEELP